MHSKTHYELYLEPNLRRNPNGTIALNPQILQKVIRIKSPNRHSKEVHQSERWMENLACQNPEPKLTLTRFRHARELLTVHGSKRVWIASWYTMQMMVADAAITSDSILSKRLHDDSIVVKSFQQILLLSCCSLAEDWRSLLTAPVLPHDAFSTSVPCLVSRPVQQQSIMHWPKFSFCLLLSLSFYILTYGQRRSNVLASLQLQAKAGTTSTGDYSNGSCLL